MEIFDRIFSELTSDEQPRVLQIDATHIKAHRSDHIGAKILYSALPQAGIMIGDKGYDSDEYRSALAAKGIAPCIPPRTGRKHPVQYCKTLYKQRYKVEIVFNRLKDWRRIATRYDRCADLFFAAITLAAIIIWWG